jgi:hypothetical protein
MPGIKKTMKEFKAGSLRSGSKSGPPVTNPKQAIAIGLNEQRKEAVPGLMQTRQDLKAMRTSTLPKAKRRG